MLEVCYKCYTDSPPPNVLSLTFEPQSTLFLPYDTIKLSPYIYIF